MLYTLRFLHQTTTTRRITSQCIRCISCVFYIKPQLPTCRIVLLTVVYLAFSTSNHNCVLCLERENIVVYLAFSTSNHNLFLLHRWLLAVVYLAFSTSNHNQKRDVLFIEKLYILRFLHQTTTFSPNAWASLSCISCVFYIKPQQDLSI